jgi:hypothetical protein
LPDRSPSEPSTWRFIRLACDEAESLGPTWPALARRPVSRCRPPARGRAPIGSWNSWNADTGSDRVTWTEWKSDRVPRRAYGCLLDRQSAIHLDRTRRQCPQQPLTLVDAVAPEVGLDHDGGALLSQSPQELHRGSAEPPGRRQGVGIEWSEWIEQRLLDHILRRRRPAVSAQPRPGRCPDTASTERAEPRSTLSCQAAVARATMPS